MRELFTRALAIAALSTCTVPLSEPASALGIRNCTDIDIRVNVYKGKDKVKLIPVRGGKATIGRGKLRDFRIGKGGYQIRAYRLKKLTARILEQKGLRHNKVYSIRGRKGHYSVSSDGKCPPAGAVLLPANGVWVTKRKGGDRHIRIKRRSPTSFDVTYLPNGATHPFTQSNGDRYSNGYNASFEIRSETDIVRIDHLMLDSKDVYRFVRP